MRSSLDWGYDYCTMFCNISDSDGFSLMVTYSLTHSHTPNLEMLSHLKILKGMLYVSRCYFWCWNGKTKFENFSQGKSMSVIFLYQINWKLYMSENIKCGASSVNLSRISNFEKWPILGIVITFWSFFLQNL